MAEGKKIEDIITQLREAKKDMNKEQSANVDNILKALDKVSKSLVSPEKIDTSRGGDMYKLSGLPGMQSDAYVITGKNAQSPGAICSEEDVNVLVSLMAEQIAKNGESSKGVVVVPKKNNTLVRSVIGLLTAAVVTLGVTVGFMAHQNNTQENENSKGGQVTVDTQRNYKDLVDQQLMLVESGYNSLLNNYAALQGSENLESFDSTIKDLTGFETMEQYLRHIQQEYRAAKSFCDQNSNEKFENNDEFKQIYENLRSQDIFGNACLIRRIGCDILSGAITYNLNDLGPEFDSFDLDGMEE